jgi:peptidyl-prolyl cis-trans isomerase A (cyclophilin A)
MVQIQRSTRKRRLCQHILGTTIRVTILCFIGSFLLFFFSVPYMRLEDDMGTTSLESPKAKPFDESRTICDYKSIADLQSCELFPVSSSSPDGNNRRHMVTPPEDTKITLVCCETTAGQLSIAVHDSWAPIGAKRFLEMVSSDYFMSRVPLMRCVRNFLCQFGLPGDVTLNKRFQNSIPDDVNWLPEGPNFRFNKDGVKRFARGYMAYAGSGKNSRSNQLIVALQDNARLGGGSPWEVPFGEVVGAESYITLSKINTEYGEHGPSQGRLRREGYTEQLEIDFPSLDYITSCLIVDEKIMKEQ